jgi:hypothetical protein
MISIRLGVAVKGWRATTSPAPPDRTALLLFAEVFFDELCQLVDGRLGVFAAGLDAQYGSLDRLERE